MTATDKEPGVQEATPPAASRPRFTPPRDGDIFKLMSKVMAKIKAIGKAHRNEQQNYNFRSIDDAYDAVQPALVDAGVFCTPRVVSHEAEQFTTDKKKRATHIVMVVEFEWCAPDGSSITSSALGEAIDYADKAANKAMTAAYKYTLLQTFCIPLGDGGKDRDADFQTPDRVPYAEERRHEAPSDGERMGVYTAGRGPKNHAEDDTPEQATMRKEIFEAIIAASDGATPEQREGWTEDLTSFTPKGKERVAGVRRLQFLSGVKPGKKTGRLEILHGQIKKGGIDKAAFAEWQEKQNAEGARVAQDRAADAPQAAPDEKHDLYSQAGDDDETIPF